MSFIFGKIADFALLEDVDILRLFSLNIILNSASFWNILCEESTVKSVISMVVDGKS